MRGGRDHSGVSSGDFAVVHFHYVDIHCAEEDDACLCKDSFDDFGG
jgi:hypothetical protein